MTVDPSIAALVGGRIEQLRKRLLDFSRRNPLVHVAFRSTSSSFIRVVDELPDLLRLSLTNESECVLAPLPPIAEDPKDELSEKFLDELFLARREDPIYLAAMDALDPNDPAAIDKERQLERELKDRLREKLGLPGRTKTDAISLVEHAESHGINPKFDLPHPGEVSDDGRHEDDRFQTLLTPDRLRRAGKNVLTKGQSIEREIGINAQHAVLGFLEWKHPEEKDTYFSPLVLVEVRFSRHAAVSGEEYRVTGAGEPSTNTTLREKLLTEYKLEIPEYEGGSIEDYFDLVREKQPPGWGWRVRRQVTFGIFPSSRMAMYHDLDPQKRPLSTKPIIGQLLASAGSGGPGEYALDYDPDTPANQSFAPYIVRDADASQWSALVDVLSGKNVAIEGPPGSGKSQTIVNIIAACLSAGKRVLFVAEKLTALDVVKSRIEAVGLGEFVLPLQAGKASSDTVYTSIEDRLNLYGQTNPQALSEFQFKKEQLEAQKRVLQGYLDILGQDFGRSGLSVHTILGRSVKTSQVRNELPRDIRRAIVPSIKGRTRAEREELVGSAEDFSRALAALEDVPPLLLEVTTEVTSRELADDITEAARELAERVRSLRSAYSSTDYAHIDPEAWKSTDFSDCHAELTELSATTALIGQDIVLFLLDEGNRADAINHSLAIGRAENARSLIAEKLVDPNEKTAELDAVYVVAEQAGGVLDPQAATAELERLRNHAKDCERALSVFQRLGAAWSVPGLTMDVISRLSTLISETPKEILDLTSLGSFDEVRSEVDLFLVKLERIKKKDELGLLPRSNQLSASELLEASEVIQSSGFLSSFGRRYKDAVDVYRMKLGGNDKAPKGTMVRVLRECAEWLKECRELDDPQMRARFGAAFNGSQTEISYLTACRDYSRKVHETLSEWPNLARDFLSGSSTKFANLEVTGVSGNIDRPTIGSDLAKTNGLISAIEAHLPKVRSARQRFKGQGAVTKANLEAIRDALIERDEADDLVARLASKLPTVLVQQSGQSASLCGLLEELLTKLGHPLLAKQVQRSGQMSDFLQFANAQDELLRSRDTLVDLAGLDAIPVEVSGIVEMEQELLEFSAKPNLLMHLAAVRRSERRLRQFGLDDVVEWALEAGRDLAAAKFGEIIAALVNKNLADAVFDEHGTTLRGYSGEELNAIRKDIAKKDREVIELTRKVVRHQVASAANPPGGVSTGKKSDFTEMALIRNELGKKRRRVPVRELTRRSWRALMELKPCWMMSPLAVSQFLRPEAKFDLVIIDEASQMTPENALGAISRADQVVIVGDTKQLPPTSFFARAIDDSDLDDDLREDAESILDLANLVFTPMRQLRWHYRSQHADLIRFSNHWMYDEKLTIFPSADGSHAGLGVELVEVDGVYSGQVNVSEARRVVDAAVRFMQESPDVSLGICTMNTKQRDLIEEEIERERERYPHVEAYISDWEERNDGLESFFVKNLEAIQGDERDVMFISTLYGPESPGGKTHQRFGPINTAQGHRRLNVLFSRAKKKIVTFTSMSPTDILTGDDKSKGVRMLRNWLEYCKTGQLGERASMGGEYESPFEEHVAHMVESLGYEVVPQVGTAGYRVDLGIRHADWPHGFIAGVECDGAAYHSSRSARDRDRLREEILERLGWKLCRIWSTDWFSNPEDELARVKKFLAKRLTELKALPPRKSVSSFNEIIKRPAPAVTQRRAIPAAPTNRDRNNRAEANGRQGSLFEPAATARPANGPAFAAPIVQNRVRVGCSVVINQDGELKTYRISSSEENDPNRGILRKDAPLAKAMLDLEVGDDFEYPTGNGVKSALIAKITHP